MKEFRVSAHWTIRLPSMPIELPGSDEYFPRLLIFEHDSLLLKVGAENIGVEAALLDFEYAKKAEKQNLPVGSCLGGFSGDYKFQNYFAPLKHLSGVILDTNDKGLNKVFFDVKNALTGERLVLLFESVDKRRIPLIHLILRRINYIP